MAKTETPKDRPELIAIMAKAMRDAHVQQLHEAVTEMLSAPTAIRMGLEPHALHGDFDKQPEMIKTIYRAGSSACLAVLAAIGLVEV